MVFPCKCDKLDNVQKYMVLQTAKELLKHLNDEYDSFPYEVYYDGSEALAKAMAYVDDELIHHGIK